MFLTSGLLRFGSSFFDIFPNFVVKISINAVPIPGDLFMRSSEAPNSIACLFVNLYGSFVAIFVIVISSSPVTLTTYCISCSVLLDAI